MPGSPPPPEPLLGLPLTGLTSTKSLSLALAWHLGLSGPGVLGEEPLGRKTSVNAFMVLISAFVPAPCHPYFPFLPPPVFVSSRESPVISAFAPPPPHVHTQLSPHTHQPYQSAGSILLEPAQALSLTAPSAVPIAHPDCCCTRTSHAHHSIPRPFPSPAFSVKIVVSLKMLLSDWFLNSTVLGNLGLLVGRHVKIVSRASLPKIAIP